MFRLLVSSLTSAETRNIEISAEKDLLSGKNQKYEEILAQKNEEIVNFKSKLILTLKELENLETLFKQEKSKDSDSIMELKSLIG